MPITKKNGKIQICIDFRDLNAACPKDKFPLSITDVMIDNTYDFERMSFMDELSGYNQIKMLLENNPYALMPIVVNSGKDAPMIGSTGPAQRK